MEWKETQTDLLDGWREEAVPNTDQTFYYNYITGESSDRKPVKMKGQFARDDPVLERDENRETSVVEPSRLVPDESEISWIETNRVKVEDETYAKERSRQDMLHKEERLLGRNMLMMSIWSASCPFR